MAYSTEQCSEMLKIVCDALYAGVNSEEYTPTLPAVSGLEEQCGCFVTLKTKSQLRGCIGCFVAQKPLYLTLAEYARASLLSDPRFAGRRIQPAELPEVDIDISVLTPLQPCSEPENICLGKDGIYVLSRYGSGCFLPQVATETGWSVAEFWGNCCQQKAGLAYDAWKGNEVELFIFQAEIIEGRYSRD